jgi:hypothetical protein
MIIQIRNIGSQSFSKNIGQVRDIKSTGQSLKTIDWKLSGHRDSRTFGRTYFFIPRAGWCADHRRCRDKYESAYYSDGLRLPPNMFTSDQQRNIKSLQKLAQLNPSVICFGHGPVLQNTNRKFEQFVAKSSTVIEK